MSGSNNPVQSFCKDPYEELANAIVLQAVSDYRSNMEFLRKHPRTPELLTKAEADKAEREQRIAEWREKMKEVRADQEYKKWLTAKHKKGAVFNREAFKKRFTYKPTRKQFPLSESEALVEEILYREQDVVEIERFFRSSWYKELTEVDGEFLLGKLREEFEDEGNRVPETDREAG